jgi:hypothetical protein
MKNLNESRPDEKTGVFRALEVFQNFAETLPDRVIPVLLKIDIISWLLNRICVKEDKFDHLRLFVVFSPPQPLNPLTRNVSSD